MNRILVLKHDGREIRWLAIPRLASANLTPSSFSTYWRAHLNDNEDTFAIGDSPDEALGPLIPHHGAATPPKTQEPQPQGAPPRPKQVRERPQARRSKR